MYTLLNFTAMRFILTTVDCSEHDKEGRVITAEYEKFFLVAACKFKFIKFSYMWANLTKKYNGYD